MRPEEAHSKRGRKRQCGRKGGSGERVAISCAPFSTLVDVDRSLTYREQSRNVNYAPPNDLQALVVERKGKPIDAIVEQVLNGSMVRARLMLSQQEHQFVLVQMAAVRSPRAKALGSRVGEQVNEAEEWGDEVFNFLPSPPFFWEV
jgi:hypothetical protein